MQGSLEHFRLAELTTVKGWLPPGARVLEIGGGSGFQASVMAAWGCQPVSLDLAARPPADTSYFPVESYDGVHIPALPESFDLIFSSNVLEHVRDLPALLDEMRRVLKPHGLAIHILPTPAWRFWTSLAHYVDLLWSFIRPRPAAVATEGPAIPEQHVARLSFGRRLWGKMFAGPHGEYPSAPAELYYFSRQRWLRVFAANGFAVEQTFSTGIFYTGYTLCPNLSLATRHALARWLGAACRVYIMKKAAP